jgi:hypothetical protein
LETTEQGLAKAFSRIDLLEKMMIELENEAAEF